ncbi:MAG: hypothetical protein ACI9WU_001198 [Myxococcota bacterium]|jgi:hypothetical protein
MEEGIHMHEILNGYFHEQVTKSARDLSVDVPPETQMYLADLCTRFANPEALFAKTEGRNELEPLALIMERALEGDEIERIRTLRHLGDTALYTSGFFADKIERTGVDVEYYVQMGGMAYSNVSSLAEGRAGRSFHGLYSSLSNHFHQLVTVLWELADRARMTTSKGLLETYQKWEETGSDRLRRHLMKQGFVLSGTGRAYEC